VERTAAKHFLGMVVVGVGKGRGCVVCRMLHRDVDVGGLAVEVQIFLGVSDCSDAIPGRGRATMSGRSRMAYRGPCRTRGRGTQGLGAAEPKHGCGLACLSQSSKLVIDSQQGSLTPGRPENTRYLSLVFHYQLPCQPVTLLETRQGTEARPIAVDRGG
jgi:hypothetical protein